MSKTALALSAVFFRGVRWNETGRIAQRPIKSTD